MNPLPIPLLVIMLAIGSAVSAAFLDSTRRLMEPLGIRTIRTVGGDDDQLRRDGKEGFLREIREQVGEVRPAFVNGFVHC